MTYLFQASCGAGRQGQTVMASSFTALLTVVSLLLQFIGCVSPQDSLWPCPVSCTCREDHVEQVGRVYAVLCSHQKLTRVPDLVPLRAVDVAVLLKLDYCDLQNITRNDLPEGVRLAILHLNGNAGLHVAHDAFADVRDTLVVLDMQATNLPFSKVLHFLSDCTSLQELSLSFNNKGVLGSPHVQAPLFKGLGLTSLKKLKLYNCNVRTLTDGVFEGAESLENIHLGSNQLTEVPRALMHLQNLQSLDLSSNAIVNLTNGSFNSLGLLQELTLRKNEISLLENGAFHGLNNSLATLSLEFCGLHSVPTEALRPLENLTSLDLTGNRFTDVGPEAFIGSYCLSELYISSMTMDFNGLMFAGQKLCIKDLKIRRANLTEVPLKPITDLVNLQYLFLDKNNITRLRTEGLKGVSATTICLSDNPIRVIEKGAFSGLRPKVNLLLEKTQVSDLNFIFDYPVGTFGFLSLYESPIPCDCVLDRIRHEMPESFLYGTCSHEGKAINLKNANLDDILKTMCRPLKPAPTNSTMSLLSITLQPWVLRQNYVQKSVTMATVKLRESVNAGSYFQWSLLLYILLANVLFSTLSNI